MSEKEERNMKKETQDKLIALPIKLEHRTYRTGLFICTLLDNLIMLIITILVITGACWFITH